MTDRDRLIKPPTRKGERPCFTWMLRANSDSNYSFIKWINQLINMSTDRITEQINYKLHDGS